MKEEAVLQAATTLAAAVLSRYPEKPTSEDVERELIAATQSVEKVSEQLGWPGWLRPAWLRKK